MTGVTGKQLAATIVIALAVHAAIAVSVFWVSPPSGAQAQGLGGVEVSLGPAGGAPGDVSKPASETPEALVAKPEETPVEPAPVAQVATEQAVPEQPVAEPQPVAPVDVAEVPPVLPPTLAVATPVEAMPVQVAEARPVAPRPKPRQKPKPPEPPGVEPPAVKATAPREQVALQPPSISGTAGRSGTRDQAQTGSANDTAGGGAPGASADYMSYLLAWLQKHKEYPRDARRRNQQGTALLYFEIDREGRILNAKLQQSSGYGSLDGEALALIRRAEPLPMPPPEVQGDPIRLVVPVQFFLR